MTSSIVQAYHRRGESSQCDAKTRRFGAQGQNYGDAAVSHKTPEVLEIETMRRGTCKRPYHYLRELR